MKDRWDRWLLALIAFAVLYFTAHIVHALVWGAWS